MKAGNRVIITMDAFCCEMEGHDNIPAGTVCKINDVMNDYGIYTVETLDKFGVMTATFNIIQKHLIKV